MPSYTTSLRLIQPSTGEYPGDWGNQVNSSLTAVVDKAVAGTATITMTAANYTLTNANGVADEAKSMFLVLQGTPGASYFVIVPTASKLYFVTNNTGFAQSVSTSASGGVSVPNGASMVLRCDGTNVVEAQNALGSIVLNGGTANGVAYLNASKALTTGSALTFDGTNFATTGTATATKLIPTGGTATGNGMYLSAANTLAWSTNGAQAMTLDASGNLLVGGTSGSARLNVIRTATGYAVNTSFYNDSTNTAGYCALTVGQAATGSATGLIGTGGSTASNAAFQNTFVVGTQSSHPFVVVTNDTERARITSGGEFLVGTTNASVGTAVGCRIVDSGARLEVAKAASTNSDIGLSQYSTGAAAYRFYVGYGGTIYATSTTITAISDQRLKENIRDLDAGLSEVMALKPRKFDWKAGKGKDKKNDRGWIAQEFEQVFPDMVDTWQDPAPEGEEPYKAVNADLIPVLVKAVQEQQAIIEDLRARVAALEQA